MMLRQKPNQILGQIVGFLRHYLQIARARTVAWFKPSQRRLRLRRRLFLYTAPVAALLALVVAGLISVVMVGNSAVDSFNRHDIEALRIDVDKLKKFGVIEPGNIAFAEADLLVLEGKLNDAEARFSDALERFDGDDSCPVRINLELVRETLADLAVRSGLPDEADRLYNSALSVVKDAPDGCFLYNADPNEERRAVRADAKPRLDRKLAALHAPPPPRPTGPAVVTPEPPPPPPALPPPPGQGIGQGENPGQGPGLIPGQQQAPGQDPGQGPPPPPQGPGAAPALPPVGQGGAPELPPLAPGGGQTATETPPLPALPGENLPEAPPPPPGPPGGQPPAGPGDGPLQVADPAAPNPAQILGPVGPDGLPLGDKNTSAPDLRLEGRDGLGSDPGNKLQAILEDSSSYGGERE